MYTAYLALNIAYHSGTFVKSDKLALMHYCHSQSRVDMRAHFDVVFSMDFNKYIMMCIHHTQKFHCPKNSVWSAYLSFPTLCFWQSLIFSLSSWFVCFSTMPYPSSHMAYILFIWFLSLCNKPLNFLHVFSFLDNTLLFSTE